MIEIRIRMKGLSEAKDLCEAAALLFGLVVREAGFDVDLSMRSTGEDGDQKLLVPEFMSKRGE